MTEPSFANQEKLVEVLWNEIKSSGMYGRSKTDFYDYVLYLLNKYDTKHFLSANDNADNERLLKIKATQIKAAKKNISVKFMDSKEYDDIFMDFVAQLGAGNVPSLSDNGTRYTMMIENPALRSALETRLKRVANTTLDYKPNTELVTVEHEAFVKMLAAEIRKDSENPDIDALLKDTLSALKSKKGAKDAIEVVERAVNAGSVVGGVAMLGIAGIKAVASFVGTRMQKKIAIKER